MRIRVDFRAPVSLLAAQSVRAFWDVIKERCVAHARLNPNSNITAVLNGYAPDGVKENPPPPTTMYALRNMIEHAECNLAGGHTAVVVKVSESRVIGHVYCGLERERALSIALNWSREMGCAPFSATLLGAVAEQWPMEGVDADFALRYVSVYCVPGPLHSVAPGTTSLDFEAAVVSALSLNA